ncbi:MAG: hypothetical protein CI953_176 [Methanohalophilus sp.]|nr:MAG: hypothetical protein CI953_176 [Methanohalophilus sp.]
MIQIYPSIQEEFICPICKQNTTPKETFWQGIHVGVMSECEKCQKIFFQDIPVGHSLYTKFSVDLDSFELFGPDNSKDWYGVPLKESLKDPLTQTINFEKKIYKKYDEVILLNCIDYLYGHSLLKLLNAESHLKNHSEYGLILIIPKFLDWMVPEGIAEKWVFDIPLKSGQKYFINFNKIIRNELHRFNKIYVSKAYSHPKNFDITNFTGVEKHDFKEKKFRVTFIWREDRIWMNYPLLEKAINKFNLNWLRYLVLYYQKRKIIKLFKMIKRTIPHAQCTVAGFGKYTRFPNWIDNKLVSTFNKDIEKNLCNIYSKSRVVFGIHGSNMLLPSAHAGMCVDLMPYDRWGNFAQDILYQENDVRMSSYRYRFMPINVKKDFLHDFIVGLISKREHFVENMTTIDD